MCVTIKRGWRERVTDLKMKVTVKVAEEKNVL